MNVYTPIDVLMVWTASMEAGVGSLMRRDDIRIK
jgi:hypothetical protein